MRGSSGPGCTRPAERTRARANTGGRVRRSTQASLRVRQLMSGAVRTLGCTRAAAPCNCRQASAGEGVTHVRRVVAAAPCPEVLTQQPVYVHTRLAGARLQHRPWHCCGAGTTLATRHERSIDSQLYTVFLPRSRLPLRRWSLMSSGFVAGGLGPTLLASHPHRPFSSG